MLARPLLYSCGLDNYDEPKSILTGKVVYNGEALQLRGTDEKVRLQIYQDGYPNYSPIDVFVGQDGSFSAALFDGEYKMVTRDNNGPWVNARDTTHFKVKGTTVQNKEVTPLFTISGADIKLSGTTVNADFVVNQIVDGREIDYISVLFNKTQFVDIERKLEGSEHSVNSVIGTHTYSLELKGKAVDAPILFGRICVKTRGVDEAIYSPVFRLR